MTNKMHLAIAIIALLAGARWVFAQDGGVPCGIDVIRAGRPKVDDRFVPSPPEHVKYALLRAFPDVGWKVTKDEGLYLQGEKDMGLTQVLAQKNNDEGAKGRNSGVGALGKWSVDLKEATQDGVHGTQIHIEFHSNKLVGRAAGTDTLVEPLGDETACLSKLLSGNDPVANPRGLDAAGVAISTAVMIPDGTPVTVLLFDPLYSKKLSKDSAGASVNFEVMNDVAVNGVVVIRRGALAVGHFTDVEKTKNRGRHAEIAFAFDSVTSVDGQKVPVVPAKERVRGGRKDETAAAAWSMGLVGVAFMHGTDASHSCRHIV